MVIEKWHNRMMVMLTEHVNALGGSTILYCLSSWQFRDFCDVFLPNIGKGQKEVLPSKHGAPAILPYGESGPDYCITFIKRLGEGLR